MLFKLESVGTLIGTFIIELSEWGMPVSNSFGLRPSLCSFCKHSICYTLKIKWVDMASRFWQSVFLNV